MADVKYTESSWEKMGTTIGTLIGSGWGRGVTDELTDVTKNLEKAESDIDTYDEDGIISFSHTSYTSKYSEIAEKFNVLKTFTSKVNQVLCDEIDDEFYKQIDDYVETMEGLNIDSYTTKNTLGIKEKRIVQVSSSMAEEQLFEKGSISLNDIFNGANPVSDMMSTEWANYKASNPDTEMTYADYKSSAIHSGAFEYESIRDKQNKKELIFNIVSTVVTVAVGFVFPPAGFALGAAFGAYELACAGFGKDFVSGRELGTGERWTRGVFGTIGVVGGVKGLTSFSKNVNLVKGVSDTKTQHIVKMMQNSSRGKYKDLTHMAKNIKSMNSINNVTKRLNEIKDPKKKGEYLLQLSENLDVSTKKNKSIFYAGRTQYYDKATGQMKTVTAREMAEAYADQLFKNKGVTKLTLERTPGGKWMDDLQLFKELSDGTYEYSKWGLSESDANKIWSNLSSRYADGASGAVTAFTKNVPDIYKPKTIFWSTELPQLRANPNVTHINIR
ncbi:hypothetical protein ACYSNR_00430 [Enterococcus sp. LJL128]